MWKMLASMRCFDDFRALRKSQRVARLYNRAVRHDKHRRMTLWMKTILELALEVQTMHRENAMSSLKFQVS